MSGKGDEMKGEQASRSDPEATTSGIETSERKPKPSCASKFDAVYFCYSPVYQMSQYYRYGELDDCITYGTNFQSDKPAQERGPCMWELKDFETAQKDWDKVFNSPE